jgi:hypothetical protein
MVPQPDERIIHDHVAAGRLAMPLVIVPGNLSVERIVSMT